MPESDLIARLIFYLIVLLMAISAHEAAHAWMSSRYGDDTARLLGRVTLNPVAHIDPLGTLLIPIASFLFAAMGGPLASFPLIGWGKPTPVNPLKWRNKDTANVMVSLAGIMVNTLLAVAAFVVIKVLMTTHVVGAQTFWYAYNGASAGEGTYAEPVAMLLVNVLTMNASLAVFNLMPFPPLDGSKVLYSILPESAAPLLDTLEQYGYIILMAAVYFGIFRAVYRPVWNLIRWMLFGF
ncbi:MAG TPA: site-2 protease family protein [Pyrinomonadaceae bacterium]|jgi:Zn-dependent protease|nr:site-2 protease family protein [Pyrinomonadaceae bacterium]